MKSKPKTRKPETLKLGGNWKDAMKKAMGKKKPDSGWPKPSKK